MDLYQAVLLQAAVSRAAMPCAATPAGAGRGAVVRAALPRERPPPATASPMSASLTRPPPRPARSCPVRACPARPSPVRQSTATKRSTLTLCDGRHYAVELRPAGVSLASDRCSIVPHIAFPRTAVYCRSFPFATSNKSKTTPRSFALPPASGLLSEEVSCQYFLQKMLVAQILLRRGSLATYRKTKRLTSKKRRKNTLNQKSRPH